MNRKNRVIKNKKAEKENLDPLCSLIFRGLKKVSTPYVLPSRLYIFQNGVNR